jgi:hypothetical protein
MTGGGGGVAGRSPGLAVTPSPGTRGVTGVAGVAGVTGAGDVRDGWIGGSGRDSGSPERRGPSTLGRGGSSLTSAVPPTSGAVVGRSAARLTMGVSACSGTAGAGCTGSGPADDSWAAGFDTSAPVR